jgi:cysteinyl-tRNA synthetase
MLAAEVEPIGPAEREGMKVYNTLTRQKEDFATLQPGKVSMYVCGPNLYDACHVGHALSYVVFDAIRRYLQFSGYAVKHVQNFTDIEDRIIGKAQALNTTVGDLSEHYIARFFQEMDALNIQRAHVYPRATRVIPTMIQIIQGLIEKGNAYALENGDVYFRVASKPGYGALSNRTLDDMQAGTRIEPDPRKEHPMDFSLWKSAKSGEPSWPSPWGLGRPGWHIECSAMSMLHLGEQLDIHGGGHDVIFPHHENEIAQSESYTGKQFVRYWLHNALLKLPGEDEKMTRHLGNMITIREALARYSADAIRLFILSSHYRATVTWTDEGLVGAEKGVDRLRMAVRDDDPAGKVASPVLATAVDRAHTDFAAAMDDDFGTPLAIAALFDLTREVNRARDEGHGVSEGVAALRELSGVLGLTLRPVEATAQDVKPFVDLLVNLRAVLRSDKQWAAADRVRDELARVGITLEDSPQGTAWKAG